MYVESLRLNLTFLTGFNLLQEVPLFCIQQHTVIPQVGTGEGRMYANLISILYARRKIYFEVRSSCLTLSIFHSAK